MSISVQPPSGGSGTGIPPIGRQETLIRKSDNRIFELLADRVQL